MNCSSTTHASDNNSWTLYNNKPVASDILLAWRCNNYGRCAFFGCRIFWKSNPAMSTPRHPNMVGILIGNGIGKSDKSPSKPTKDIPLTLSESKKLVCIFLESLIDAYSTTHNHLCCELACHTSLRLVLKYWVIVGFDPEITQLLLGDTNPVY